MKKIKCAVVGVGYLGTFHAEKYKLLPQAELIAVCDIIKERCDKIAKKHQVTAIYDYRLLAGKVAAVSIAANTSCHYEVARFFLENNTHVLVEKPITVTVEEAENLIQLAKKNGLVLQVGHLERFNPVLIYASKQFENPRFIESTRLSPFKDRGTDVNVILDLMIHDIDIIQQLVCSNIASIDAIGTPVISSQYDITNARLRFKNGCVANVTASRVSINSERKLRIFQSNAYMSLDLHNKVSHIFRKGKGQMLAGIPDVSVDQKSFDNCDALRDEIKSFLTAILKQKLPIVSGEDGKNALATAIKITKIVEQTVYSDP